MGTVQSIEPLFSVIGRCKLCQRRTFLRRSHIFSKFALRNAQGNDAQQLLRVTSEGNPRLPLNQSWDQEYLLCSNCEDRRRSWEAIVAETIANRSHRQERRPELYYDRDYPRDLIHAENIQYGPVKLWVLSTLFLMHHATGSDWLGFVLTASEEQRLRNRLRSGDPGSDLDFQIFGRVTVRSSVESKERGGIIVPGYITEWKQGRIRTRAGYFSVLDCDWVVSLGDWPDNPMRDARLRENGTWRPLWGSEDEVMIEAVRRLKLTL